MVNPILRVHHGIFISMALAALLIATGEKSVQKV
jgi:hypothetical protein